MSTTTDLSVTDADTSSSSSHDAGRLTLDDNHLSTMLICKQEIYAVVSVSIKIVINNSLEVTFLLVDMIMLGHLGRGHLASAAISTALFNIVWSFIEGVLTAQDTFCCIAVGNNDYKSLQYWSIVSLFNVALLSTIGTVLFCFSSVFSHHLFFLSDHVVYKSSLYLLILIPSLWSMSIFRVIQKYLQAQNIMNPSILVLVIGNIINFVLNYIFMYATDIGFKGCAISTSITRSMMAMMMLYYIVKLSNTTFQAKLEYACRKRYRALRRLFCQVAVWIGTRLYDLYHKYVSKSVPRRARSEEEDVELTLLVADTNAPSSSSGTTARQPTSISDVNVNIYDGSDDDSDDTNVLNAASDKSNGVHTWILRFLSSGTSKDFFEPVVLSNDITATSHSNSDIVVSFRAVAFSSIRFLLLGIPGGLMFGLEQWFFSACIILLSHMGTIPLDSSQIIFIVTTIAYVSIPFALSTTSTIRIGNCLGGNKYKRARIISYISISISLILAGIVSYIVYTISELVGYMFTNDYTVIYRVTQLAPIAAGFQASYSLQGCIQGILRAAGKQVTIASMIFIFLWLVGLPVAVYLGYYARPTYGLLGFWYGITLGMTLLAIILLILLIGTINWQMEARRAIYRLRKQGTSGGSLEYIATVRPGSMSYGGIPLFAAATEDQEEELILIIDDSNSV